MFGCHLYVGRCHPHHPRKHQCQRDVQARHLAVFKARIVPEPPLTYSALAPLPLPVSAAVPSVAGILLFPAVRTRQILPPDIDLLAEGGLGRYEQRMLDRRDMLAPAPLPRGVAYALARGALARKRDPVPCTLRALGGHIPAVPAQGLDLVAFLVDVAPAARYTLLRRPALPGFPGFPVSPRMP